MTAISNELVSVMLFALKNELSRMEAREVDQAAAQSKIVNKVNSKNQHCADHPFVVELKGFYTDVCPRAISNGTPIHIAPDKFTTFQHREYGQLRVAELGGVLLYKRWDVERLLGAKGRYSGYFDWTTVYVSDPDDINHRRTGYVAELNVADAIKRRRLIAQEKRFGLGRWMFQHIPVEMGIVEPDKVTKKYLFP